jgi:hypothetical protein
MSRKNIALRLFTSVLVLLLLPAAANAGVLFKTTKSYETGGYYAASIAVGDVNGDGKLDVVVANACGSGCGALGLVLLLGNGDGTFGAPQNLGDQPVWFALADVNGDGKLDLIEGVEGAGTTGTAINLRLGNGDGTFQVAQSYSLDGGGGQIAIAVSDLNGDGNADLIALTTCAVDDCTHAVLGILLGNGDGTFQPVQSYAAGCGGISNTFDYDAGNLIALTDANRDGNLDIIIGSQCGSVGVFFGNGDGTFQAIQTYVAGGSSIAIADFNGDGAPDVAVTINSTVGVLLNNGDGTFSLGNFYDTGGYGPTVAAGDVNGDGIPDLLAANFCTPRKGNQPCSPGTVGVLLGNGDGTFQDAQFYNPGGAGTAGIVLADVNGDGKPDVLVTNYFAKFEKLSFGTVGVLLNKFLSPTSTTINSAPNPSVSGQSVTLTASVVSKGVVAPTGTVEFKNGTKSLGSAMLSGGVATFKTTKLPVGTLSLAAAYRGDKNSVKSTSGVLLQVVNPAAEKR